jgi:ABC-2 type transport system ATP-binding protein
MSANALEIRGLKKSYGAFTLGPLDLTVPMGAIYGFVGPNGSGKTTTIDLIFGLGKEDAGTITALGLDHRRDEKAMKLRTGYVGPELTHSSWGRVGRIIAFVKGFYPTWDDQYCQQLMETFGLHPDARVLTLSFGARIKLSLMLALSWRPQLLVLDEPTVGLDAISKRQVFAELLSAVQGEDRAVFISSHGITDLERFADHVGMIRQGQLVFEGPMADILERFRLIDLPAEQGARIEHQAGVLVQQKAGSRWRLLVDQQTFPSARLAQQGLTPLSDAGLSLEDLFVALGQSA